MSKNYRQVQRYTYTTWEYPKEKKGKEKNYIAKTEFPQFNMRYQTPYYCQAIENQR